MNTLTLAICGKPYVNGPQDSGFHIRRFAFIGDGETGHVRPADANYALSLVRRLTDSADTSWTEGHPTDDVRRLFDIIVDVENHGKPNARYAVDYRKYNGCPLAAVSDGMEIYASIRKNGVRPAMKLEKKKEEQRKRELAARREAAETKARIEAQTPRFAVDAFYGYTVNDGFGHLVGKMLTVLSIGDNRGAARVRTTTGEKTVRLRDYGNGQGEYLTLGNSIVRAADRIVKEPSREAMSSSLHNQN